MKHYLKASQLEELISSQPSEREMHLGSEVHASSFSAQGRTEKPGGLSTHSLALKKYLISTLLPLQIHAQKKIQRKRENKPHIYFNRTDFFL